MSSPIASAPGPRAFLQSADELMFASCLDNARKCFLVLKCVYLPLLVVCGVVMAVLNVLWSAHAMVYPDAETIQGMMQPVLHMLHL